MKASKQLTLWAVMLSLYIPAFAQQCINPNQTVTYDTTVIGSGNTLYNFTFPKFNAPTGTLVEVRINAKVSLKYSFQLENRELITINNYKVKVFRDDEISSSALLTPITNLVQKTYGSFLLAANDLVDGSGLDFLAMGPLPVLNQVGIGATVYNTGDYLGVGTVSFDYNATTYSSVLGSVNNIFNSSAQDTINFRITYVYCPTWFLNADITAFSATRRDATIAIKWITQNEKLTRRYELQKSLDGKKFTGVAEFAAQADATETGTYRHTYTLESPDKKRLIFRVKQIDKDGTAKYSPLRIIELPGQATEDETPRLYPNPTKGPATLLFNNVKRGDWQVDVLTLSGQLMRRYNYSNSLVMRINNNNELNPGLYLVKAVNKSTQEQYIQRLVVQ